MKSWLSWKHAILLIIYSLRWTAITAVTTMQCEDLHCHNGSPCRTVTSGNISKAECLCEQGWVGETCQTKIHLKVIDVTMTTVKLETESFNNEQAKTSLKLNSNTDLKQHSNYSLHYWKGNFSNMCNIVSMATNLITVTGLQNNTEYTFCLITDEAKMCNFDLVYRHSNVSYCTTAKTSDTKVTIATKAVSRFVFYTFIVSCVAVVALTILISVLIFSIRRRYFSHLIGARKAKRRKSRSRTTSFMMEDTSAQEAFLLTTPTTNQRISINPPSSPGKPKHQLVNTKNVGFASFSAKDDQAIALSTVIEYGEDDRNSVDSFYDNQDDQLQTAFLGREQLFKSLPHNDSC